MKQFAETIIEIGAIHERLKNDLESEKFTNQFLKTSEESLKIELQQVKTDLKFQKAVKAVIENLNTQLTKITDERDCEKMAAKGWEEKYKKLLKKKSKKPNLTRIWAKGLKRK